MARGGRRFGAGRPAYRLKAEACLRLDVRELHRRGCLAAGYAGAWSWNDSYTGERTGSVGFRVSVAELVLDYSLNGEPRTQRVPMLRTPCHFGGSRQWFGCPRCGRRVGVLYLRRGRFQCRSCAQVAYSSQSEGAVGRSWRRQCKAEAKLGENWQRPKGMHHATHERLLGIIVDCEDMRDAALCAWIAARFPGGHLEISTKSVVARDAATGWQTAGTNTALP